MTANPASGKWATMHDLRFHTVCPFHTDSFGVGVPMSPADYRRLLSEHVAFAERSGIHGMIVYNFLSSLDSMSIASLVLQQTERLRPIVAVSPFHQHPLAIARAAATLAFLYGRGIDLNLVKGATQDEQLAVGERDSQRAAHYRRMAEYLDLLNSLFLSDKTTFEGEYYKVRAPALSPPIDPAHRPLLFVPGSSADAAAVIAGRADASLLMAKPLEAQKAELDRLAAARPGLRQTIIVGLVARASDDEAWAAARSLYADNRREAINARIFLSRAISYQHTSSASFAAAQKIYDDALWYGGSKIGIDCPKLVGSHLRIANALRRYADLGVTDFIIDLPPSMDEYVHDIRVLELLRTK